MAGGIGGGRRQPASISRGRSARKVLERTFGKRRFAQLRRDAAAQRWDAAAHPAEHHCSARRPGTYRADSRVNAGRYGAENFSIATAAGKGLQSENPEHDAEHDSGARYGRIDQLRELAGPCSPFSRRGSFLVPAVRARGGLTATGFFT